MKQNPSRFFAYLRNKKKSNKTASCLRKANGQTTTCPKETADLLVESFASVFTRGKALNENCVLENMAEQINEFTVEKEEVIQQLKLVHAWSGWTRLSTSYDNKNCSWTWKLCKRCYSSLSCCRKYKLHPQPMEARNSYCLTQESST